MMRTSCDGTPLCPLVRVRCVGCGVAGSSSTCKGGIGGSASGSLAVGSGCGCGSGSGAEGAATSSAIVYSLNQSQEKNNSSNN